MINDNQEIVQIVLTGSPCGGKTTLLTKIYPWLRDRGFRVLICPEVATMMISGGLQDIGAIAQTDPKLYIEVQRSFLNIQLALRKQFLRLARSFKEPTVIVYDRGPMDGMAYMDPACFNAMLEESKHTLNEVRDSFSAVIHLVTAAIGAPDFYTTENNAARTETIEEAIAVDERTRAAWSGHPHVKIIDNSTGFDLKIKRAIAVVARVLGIPVPLEIERKYLLRSMPDLDKLPHVNSVTIEQLYLQKIEGESPRIRKRTASDGSSTYSYTVKTATPNAMIRYEREHMIKATDFFHLQNSQIAGSRKIVKKRHCFIWRNQYFELDVFESPDGLILLEIELTEENNSVDLPEFLDIDREVTEDSTFSNFALAFK